MLAVIAVGLATIGVFVTDHGVASYRKLLRKGDLRCSRTKRPAGCFPCFTVDIPWHRLQVLRLEFVTRLGIKLNDSTGSRGTRATKWRKNRQTAPGIEGEEANAERRGVELSLGRDGAQAAPQRLPVASEDEVSR